MELTQAHIDAAIDAGACAVDYKPGVSVDAIDQIDLAWFDSHCPHLANREARKAVAGLVARGAPPCSTLSGYGSGYGAGYGRGYGDGYGRGYGDGYGNGSGSGDGYGYGDGNGRSDV